MNPFYITAGIIETYDLEQLEAYLVLTDFEKAFDFLDRNFLIIALEHYCSSNDFILRNRYY